MSDSGATDIWTSPRLRARLAAEKGRAPAPRCFIIWRSTTRANATEVRGYQLPGDPRRRDEAAFERWLLERNLAGADRLSVSILVIREQLDAAGLIREGVLERRRGGVDGPYHGNVARVEFTGAAKLVRRYRAGLDGRLTELGVDDATGVVPPSFAAPIESFAGDDAAVHEFLGTDAVIIDRRPPGLFEELLGLSAVIHARRPGGAVIGCGVGWHGETSFVLAADFPRHDGPMLPPPELEAAVENALKTRDLIRHETRVDEDGFCVIARRRGTQALVAIRQGAKATRIDPYIPGRGAARNDDQRRWMTYAETYESRTILDSWRHADGEEIVVLTIDPDMEAWRHVIDTDGVEISRQPDNEAAAAVLYREASSLSPPNEPEAVPPSGASAGAPHAFALMPLEEDAPPDSLLAKARAFSDSMALLGQIRAEVASADAVPHTATDRLSALIPTLALLNVPMSVSRMRLLIDRVEAGNLAHAGLAAALDEASTFLRDELALTRIAILSASREAFPHEVPFGPAIERHFADSSHDIEEAVRCLALHRATASVLHATRVLRQGLVRLEEMVGLSGLAELSWPRLIAVVRDAPDGRVLAHSLVRLRQAWHAPGTLPAAKYTEEEAEAVLTAVEGFLRLLAARLDCADQARVG